MTTSVKEQIANVLGVPANNFWNVLSQEGSLYLVHYTYTADMSKYGHLRGTVVDLQASTIVCSSYGYTPTVARESLTVDKNHLLLEDVRGTKYNLVNPTYRIGFEGTIMRVFKHNGVVYHSTHKKINASRSRWGGSMTFLQMYQSLGGPSNEELFPQDVLTSPWVHIFLLVHPDVLLSTKQDVGPGYIVYLEVRKVWSGLGPSPYKHTKDANDPRPYAGKEEPEPRVPRGLVQGFPGTVKEPFLLAPTNLTLEEANHHLRYGFYQPFNDENLDPRLRMGEFLVVSSGTAKETTTVRVQSPAYEWRGDIMRDNNPNLLHRMYQLINDTYTNTQTPEGYAKFVSTYPLLNPLPSISLPILAWPQKPPLDASLVDTQEKRLYNVWACLLLSVPLHKQAYMVELFPSLLHAKEDVAQWLISLLDNEEMAQELSERARTIIYLARRGAQNRIVLTIPGVEQVNQEELIKEEIYKSVNREEGVALYHLVREMLDSRTD